MCGIIPAHLIQFSEQASNSASDGSIEFIFFPKPPTLLSQQRPIARPHTPCSPSLTPSQARLRHVLRLRRPSRAPYPSPARAARGGVRLKARGRVCEERGRRVRDLRGARLWVRVTRVSDRKVCSCARDPNHISSLTSRARKLH